MFAKSKWLSVCMALVFTLVFTTCEDLYSGEEGRAQDAIVPVITAQPEGGVFTLGEDAELSVSAKSPDGGSLSYKWFRATDEEYGNDEGTSLGTGSSITVSEEGAYKVYVVVTNKKGEGRPASVKSDLVSVVINDPRNAQYPNITVQPASAAYEWASGSVAVSPISVTASVTDGGVLGYQWYSAGSYSSEGGTAISGATSASYTPPAITADGTSYYYVVITNTNNNAQGDKTKTVNSSPALIRTVKSTITITGNKLQFVRGFGGMAVFWDNSPQDSVEDYEKMMNPNILGYNMLRVMIPVDGEGGSTDMRAIMKKTLKNELSGSKDRKHYYDIVKLTNKYGGYVLASPWSPPPPWKTNNSKNGGASGMKANLKKEFWPDYADYLKEYCQVMYENGAPIYAVSIQNEPNFEAQYDGCEWSETDMRDFFKMVGFFTEGVKGWGGGREIPRVLAMNGESANSPTIADPVLKDSDAYKYVDIFARHLYGSVQVTRSAEAQALGKEIWMTEMNVNGGNDATYPLDSTYNYIWKFMNLVDVSIRLNKENAFIWWYAKRFYSFIGEGDYGTIDGAILPRGWGMAHYARFAKETDQVSISVTGTDNRGTALSTSNFNNTSYDLDSRAVKATAFMSPDGDFISLVMFTPTSTSGGGGTDLGDVQIKFPAGFAATKVTAMRSKSGDGTENMGKPDTDTVLINNGRGAIINLPAGQLLSVKFTK